MENRCNTIRTPIARPLIAIVLILALAVGVAGCSSWERTTFQTLAASQATINQAQVDYEAGTLLPHSTAAYNAINAAKAAQTTAVNAMVVYENLKAANPAGASLANAQADVDTVLLQLPALIASIKALYTAAKT